MAKRRVGVATHIARADRAYAASASGSCDKRARAVVKMNEHLTRALMASARKHASGPSRADGKKIHARFQRANRRFADIMMACPS